MKVRIVLTMVALLSFTGIALANPPSAIKTSYDATRAQLSVTVQHMVANIHKHFIQEVVVTKNGSAVATKTFDFQMSHRNQTMPPFQLALQPGDDVKVKATCNLSGSKEVTVDLSTPSKRKHHRSKP